MAYDLGASKAELVEDACQRAWVVLLRRAEVPLDGLGFSWLCKVARTTGRRTAVSREIPGGGFLPAGDDRERPGEIPEPPGHASDPLERVLERERYREQRKQLAQLTARQRRFLALQALGLSYNDIAKREQVSVRTVDRQILRGARKLRRLR